jgi:hypothetical protein
VLNGTVTVGSGSGAGIAPYVISPLEGILDRARYTSVSVDWNLATEPIHYPYITNVASIADKCIVFASAFQAEGALPILSSTPPSVCRFSLTFRSDTWQAPTVPT